MSVQEPTIYTKKAEGPDDAQELDFLEQSLEELFWIENPHLANEKDKHQNTLEEFKRQHENNGVWVYYPWRHFFIRIPNEELYTKIRTNRNRDIVTPKEQNQFRNTTVGIAGLSVGSSIAHALTRTGGPKIIKLSDPDIIETSNLNRIHADITDLGQNKTETAAKKIWEIDPFAKLHLWREGITEKTLEEFIAGKPSLDVFVDQMDDLAMKFRAREICKKYKIPVVMATDVGEGVVLDIERYDQNPEYRPFHDLLEVKSAQELKELPTDEWVRLSGKIIGQKNIETRLEESLPKIGKTLVRVPQLGSSAMLAGAVAAYTIRQIAVGGILESGKHGLSIKNLLS